jgi:hypothetical protein
LVVPASWYFTDTSSPAFTNSVTTAGLWSADIAAILWLAPLATTVVALSTVNVHSASFPLTETESAATADTFPVAVMVLPEAGLSAALA